MRRANVLLVAVGSAAAGALGAHWFDPDRGRARRARASDHAKGVTRRVARRARRRSVGRARYTLGHARGVVHELTHPFHHAPEDDVTLAQKIRSEVLGQRRFARWSISVDTYEGRATLRGEVGNVAETADLEQAVRAVAGVRDVDNLLHAPGTPAPNKQDVLNVTT